MKKLLLVMVAMAAVGFNTASAEMVDIGLGQMEQSEFRALKAMVQGQPTQAGAAVSTPLERQVRYGMVEMSPADFNALRDRVAGHDKGDDAAPARRSIVKMVNIGTGEMPWEEFQALKRMVQNSVGCGFNCLAVAYP